MELKFKHPDVLAVVVNWNSGEQLQNCLRSLHQQCPVVVIDNNSSDGSCHTIEAMPGVTLHRSKENLGFAKACNWAVKNLKAKYYLFINPDAAVFSETIDVVLSYMSTDQYAHVGICGVKLVDQANNVARGCARQPTGSQLACHALGLDRFAPGLGFLMTD